MKGPKIGEIYHIYRRNNGQEFMSLIGPFEWNQQYVMSVRLNSDSVWKKIFLK